jgi:uncharacterized membrane protein YkvA (DUF1232 family)
MSSSPSSSAPRPALTEAELEQLRAMVRERAEKMTEADLTALLERQASAEKKVAKLGASLPGLVGQVRVGFSMVRDYVKGDYRKLPWWTIASIAGSLAYFLAPIDLVPDFIPLLGYIDDATVVAAVFASLREDIRRYAADKHIDLPE